MALASYVYFAGDTFALDARKAITGWTPSPIYRATKDGKDVTPIALTKATVRGIAVYGGRIYWTEGGAEDCSRSRVLSSPVDGGQPEVVADEQRCSRDLVAAADGVYWLNFGTRNDTVCPRSEDAPEGYGDHAEGSTDGELVRVTGEGARPEIVASKLASPNQLQVSGGSVYWMNSGSPACQKADPFVVFQKGSIQRASRSSF